MEGRKGEKKKRGDNGGRGEGRGWVGGVDGKSPTFIQSSLRNRWLKCMLVSHLQNLIRVGGSA